MPQSAIPPIKQQISSKTFRLLYIIQQQFVLKETTLDKHALFSKDSLFSLLF